MRTYTSKNEKSIGYSNVSSVSKQLMKLEDNRPNTSIQRKLQSLTSNVASQNIVQRIADFRSANVVQLAYNWSNIGEDGVLIGDNEEPYVIKFGGYDDLAVPMDQLGAQFGFTATNARIVQQGDPLWETVLAAKDEAGGGWNRNNDAEPKSKALVMDRLGGVALHETVDSISAEDPENPTGMSELLVSSFSLYYEILY